MTFETYKFSDATMIAALETFCTIYSVKAADLKNGLKEIIYRQTIFDSQTISTGHAFKIKWNHPLCEPLANYLDRRYSFKGHVEKIVATYDDFFNKDPKEYCCQTNGYFVFDTNERLRKIYSFEFTEPSSFGHDYMMLIEFDDSDLISLEKRIFDYYFNFFGNLNTPEELKKPLSQLSKDELSLLKMIYI